MPPHFRNPSHTTGPIAYSQCPCCRWKSEWLIEWISMLNNFYSAISHPPHTQQGPLSACHCSRAQLEAPALWLSLRRVSSYTADAHTTLKLNLVCRLKSRKTVFSASVQRIMTDRHTERVRKSKYHFFITSTWRSWGKPKYDVNRKSSRNNDYTASAENYASRRHPYLQRWFKRWKLVGVSMTGKPQHNTQQMGK